MDPLLKSLHNDPRYAVVEEAQLCDLTYVPQLGNTDKISLRHFGCAVALFSRFSYCEIAIRLAGSQSGLTGQIVGYSSMARRPANF